MLKGKYAQTITRYHTHSIIICNITGNNTNIMWQSVTHWCCITMHNMLTKYVLVKITIYQSVGLTYQVVVGRIKDELLSEPM